MRRNNLNRLAHFVAIIEAGTITGAAETLGISKAVVSKQLQLLEQDIGAPLVVRNTRHLQPTDAGRQFYEDAKSAITQANNAYERVQERDNTPKGVLRITAPVDFGVIYVAPFIAQFHDKYPDVKIDLHLTDNVVDIIEDRYDLAFRIGWLTDSSNLARKLLDYETIAVCSPKTAKRINAKHPQDLNDVPFINSEVFSSQSFWTFERNGKSENVTARVVSEMNINLAIKACVIEGYSYTIFPDFLVQQELNDGRLEHLLPDWSMRKGGVYTVTPPSRIRSNALQRFLDMTYEILGS